MISHVALFDTVHKALEVRLNSPELPAPALIKIVSSTASIIATLEEVYVASNPFASKKLRGVQKKSGFRSLRKRESHMN